MGLKWAFHGEKSQTVNYLPYFFLRVFDGEIGRRPLRTPWGLYGVFGLGLSEELDFRDSSLK